MAADHYRFRRGMAEKDGRLFIFDKHSVTVIDLWPLPRAWRKTTELPWHHCRPVLDIRLGLKAEAPHDNDSSPALPWEKAQRHTEAMYRRAVSHIPLPVQNVVRRFTPARQFHLLSLIARCPGALELCESNPALGLALSSNWIFHKTQKPMRTARSLVNKPRRVICGRLGFPATNAAVNCLARIPIKALTIVRLLYLRTAMLDPGRMRRLCFLRPNGNVIRIISDDNLWPHVSQRFLIEAGNLRENHIVPHTARDLRDTLGLWDIARGAACRAMFDSIEQLMKAHAKLTLEVNTAKTIPFRNFPAAPLAFSSALPECSASDCEVLGLQDTRQLGRHAAAQQNCALSRIQRIVSGHEYLYAILQNRKTIGTISICKTFRGWQLAEAKGPANRGLPENVRLEIQRWFYLASKAAGNPVQYHDGDTCE